MSGSGLLVMGAKTPSISLPALRRRGHCFETVTGERWTGIEASDFNLFGRFLSGEDIAPILRQRQSAGFNLLRVWTRYQLSQYGIGDCTLALHPDLYTRTPDFLRAVESFGCYVEFTAYTGREDFDSQHWNRLGEAVSGASNCFLSLINEADQPGNRIDLSPYKKHANILCSRGSNGSQVQPPGPYDWDFCELHSNNAPQEQRKWGHNSREIWDGPSWGSETSRHPDGALWTRAGTLEKQMQMAYDGARASVLLCAGSGCFHSRAGKNSTLWDEETLQVATAWATGARSMDLQWQDGAYNHEALKPLENAMDPSGANILRIYQQGDSPYAVVHCNNGENRYGG